MFQTVLIWNTGENCSRAYMKPQNIITDSRSQGANSMEVLRDTGGGGTGGGGHRGVWLWENPFCDPTFTWKSKEKGQKNSADLQGHWGGGRHFWCLFALQKITTVCLSGLWKISITFVLIDVRGNSLTWVQVRKIRIIFGCVNTTITFFDVLCWDDRIFADFQNVL